MAQLAVGVSENSNSDRHPSVDDKFEVWVIAMAIAAPVEVTIITQEPVRVSASEQTCH